MNHNLDTVLEQPTFQFRPFLLARHEAFGLMHDCLIQSPIESMLGAWLLFIDVGPFRWPEVDVGPMFERNLVYPEGWGAYLTPQATVPGVGHVDFVLSAYGCGKVKRLAIECDGHDFHEKTKEQAARDKSRDRALVQAGMHVIRFTGSEIFRDAESCVRQIEAILETTIMDSL